MSMQNGGMTMQVFCKFLAFSDSRYGSYQAYGHDKPRPHYEDVEFCMQIGIVALHRGYAEILASAVFISAKCRWCGEKLILTNVFFSTMCTALSIMRLMSESIVNRSTSVPLNTVCFILWAMTYAAA